MLQLSRKKSEQSLVGLEIEADSAAAIEIRVNGRREITGTAIAPLPAGAFHDGEVIDSDAVAESLRATFSEHGLSKRVRLGVANQRVVVRTMRVPALENPKEMEAAVRFKAEEQIPMPIDQAVLDHRVVGGVAETEETGPQVDVVVVAARRDMIASALKPIRDAGLQPIGVDLSAFGLIRAMGSIGITETPLGEAPQAASTTLFCNIGDVINLAVAKGRSCLFTRVSPAGLDGIETALSADTGIAREHSRQWLSYVGLAQPLDQLGGDPALAGQVRGALEQGASALLDELRLSLDFYGTQEGAVPVEQVVLTGPGSVIPGLVDRLASGIDLPVAVSRPEALSGLDPAVAARLTLSYGLALED